jgi:deoxyhypusine synthase
MRKVEQMKIRKMSCDELVNEFKNAGLQAGNLARAVDLMENMWREDYFIILAFSGPLVPSGMRSIFTDLIKSGKVGMIVTNGANITHDIIEAIGGEHYSGSFFENDKELHKKGIGRAGNVLVPMKNFEMFEKWSQKTFKKIGKEEMSIREFIKEIGRHLEDENSFVRQAFLSEIPVYSPGFQDSMLGLQLAFFKQENRMVVDSASDLLEIPPLLEKKKRVGAIILGGGVPKHFALACNILREGLDAAVNFTAAPFWDGGISGADLEEGKSWGKARENSKTVMVYGDSTILFPLAVASLKERGIC